MDGLTPLEKARQMQQENIIYSCHECKKCVKVGGWWYCEDSGKLLHPLMLERSGPMKCDKLVRKQRRRRRKKDA